MGRLKTYVSPAEIIAAGVNAGHVLAAEHLLQVAKALAPVEHGALEDSAAMSVDEGALTANVTFSGPYTLLMHEGLNYRHDPGKQAKFLEAPSVGEVPVFAQLMAKGAKAAMR